MPHLLLARGKLTARGPAARAFSPVSPPCVHGCGETVPNVASWLLAGESGTSGGTGSRGGKALC